MNKKLRDKLESGLPSTWYDRVSVTEKCYQTHNGMPWEGTFAGRQLIAASARDFTRKSYPAKRVVYVPCGIASEWRHPSLVVPSRGWKFLEHRVHFRYDRPQGLRLVGNDFRVFYQGSPVTVPKARIFFQDARRSMLVIPEKTALDCRIIPFPIPDHEPLQFPVSPSWYGRKVLVPWPVYWVQCSGFREADEGIGPAYHFQAYVQGRLSFFPFQEVVARMEGDGDEFIAVMAEKVAKNRQWRILWRNEVPAIKDRFPRPGDYRVSAS